MEVLKGFTLNTFCKKFYILNHISAKINSSYSFDY